jgi:hypothetical protein
MLRFKFLIAAALTATALLGTPTVGKAGFTVTVSDGMGGTLNFNDNGTGIISNSGTLDGFTIAILATSNSPGANGVALLTNQTTQITSINGTTLSSALNLTITSSSDGFTLDPTHGTLQTSLQSNVLQGSVAGVSMINGAPVTASAVALNDPNATITSNVQASWTNSFTLGNQQLLTINAGTYSSHQQVAEVQISSQVTAAPAPPGLVMLVSALPFAGLLRLRRRLAKAEAATVA